MKPTLHKDGSAVEKTGLIHRVYEPEGNGPHPTVVMIHGRNGNEDVMWVFARALPENWLLVAPRAIIKGDDDEGYSWHPYTPNKWPDLTEFDEALRAITRFIEALPDRYNADLNQLYLMGFSQGAALSYVTALHYPDMVRAIAGLVGYMPLDHERAIAGEPLADMPIFMAVGTEDERVPLTLGRKCGEVLRRAGADLEYHEYDTGHKLNAQGMNDLEAWWAQQGSTERNNFVNFTGI